MNKYDKLINESDIAFQNEQERKRRIMRLSNLSHKLTPPIVNGIFRKHYKCPDCGYELIYESWYQCDAVPMLGNYTYYYWRCPHCEYEYAKNIFR